MGDTGTEEEIEAVPSTPTVVPAPIEPAIPTPAPAPHREPVKEPVPA